MEIRRVKLLAWQIKKIDSDRAINKIELENNCITTDLVKNNMAFRSFYENLYHTEYPEDSSTQNTFVKKDIADAIAKAQGGKAAGPEFIPIDFYKTFSLRN